MSRRARLPLLAGVHILLAEEDARFAGILAAVLEWRGAMVTVACPEAALRILRTIVPTVLVVGASPVSAAALLTASRRAFVHDNGTLLPALLIARCRQTLTSDAWRAAGFQGCLTKPVELGEFCRAVSYLATAPSAKRRGASPPEPPRFWKPWLLP